MKIEKLLIVFAFICLIITSCKKSENKDTEPQKNELTTKVEEASFTVSGMTCEIGCAKIIASKLSKKDGIIDAKVSFENGTANVKYDSNRTDKKDIIKFIDGIADGETYKAEEFTGEKISCKKECEKNCKKECATNSDKTPSVKCEKKCCVKDNNKKVACADDCQKNCCSKA